MAIIRRGPPPVCRIVRIILWAGEWREEQQPLAMGLQRVLALVSQVEQQDAVLAERRLKAVGAAFAGIHKRSLDASNRRLRCRTRICRVHETEPSATAELR